MPKRSGQEVTGIYQAIWGDHQLLCVAAAADFLDRVRTGVAVLSRLDPAEQSINKLANFLGIQRVIKIRAPTMSHRPVAHAER